VNKIVLKVLIGFLALLPTGKSFGFPPDSTISGVELVKTPRLLGKGKTITVTIPVKSMVVVKLKDGSKHKGTLASTSKDSCTVTLMKNGNASKQIAYTDIKAIQKYNGFTASEILGPTVMILGDMLAIWGPGASIQLVRDGWAEYTIITIPATALGVGMGFGGRYLKGRRYRLKKAWTIHPLGF